MLPWIYFQKVSYNSQCKADTCPSMDDTPLNIFTESWLQLVCKIRPYVKKK